MSKYPTLTDKEMICLLHCRLVALERYIAATHPQFHAMMADWNGVEVDNDTQLTAAQNTKLKQLAVDIKNGYNQPSR